MTDAVTAQTADLASERTLVFWMTLVVTTVIVGFAAFVLTFAMLSASGVLPHRAAAAANAFLTVS